MEQLIMAIETGGTKIQLAIGTAQGDILYNHHAKVEREKGFRGVLDVVTGIMPELMEKAREFGGKIEKITTNPHHAPMAVCFLVMHIPV